MGTRGSTPGWSVEDEAPLREVADLLLAGQYEQVATLLHGMQLAIERRGDALPAHVFILARRICLACSQSQAEARWHQRASEEAVRRERKLQEQLGTLLGLVGDHTLSEPLGEREALPSSQPVIGPPATALLQRTQGPSLWQRVVGIVHGRLGPPSLGRPAPKAPVEALTWPSVGRAETPALFLAGEAERSADPLETTAAQEARPIRSPPAQVLEDASVPLVVDEAKADEAEADEAKKDNVPSLVVHCLGAFRVYQDAQPVEDWPSSKGKAIFKYLVTRRGRPVVKEVLMELFWPGAHPDAARNNLNVAIYGLRQALRQTRPSFSHILFQDDCYLLNPDLHLWLDIEEFSKRLRSARDLEQHGQLAEAVREYHAAEALYQGEFLEEDRYEDWLLPLRQRFQEEYLSLLDRLTRWYSNQEDDAACVTLCRKMLAVDPCCEEAHRRLMRCYYRQGQPYLALRQYHQCAEALREELDVSPTAATSELYECIRRGQRV